MVTLFVVVVTIDDDAAVPVRALLLFDVTLLFSFVAATMSLTLSFAAATMLLLFSLVAAARYCC